MAAKIPVGDTINYAFSFTFGNLMTVIGVAWLPLGIAFAVLYGLFEYGWSSFSAVLSVDPNNPQAAMSMMSQIFTFYGLMLVAVIIYSFLSAIAAVGVTSHALGLKSGTTYVYFAAGSAEWRVFGGYIRYFFASIGIMIIVGIGVALATYIGVMLAGSDGSNATLGGIVVTVLVLALYCLAILTLVRMGYLLVPSIIAEPGRGGLARSYHLTSGNFWRIFIVLLVAALPIWIVVGIIESFVLGEVFSQMFGDMFQMMGRPDPSKMMEMTRRWMEAFRGALLPIMIIQYVSAIILNGLIYAGAVYAYKALAGAPGDAAPVPATA